MSVSIHILDDDSLLNVFHLYRLIIFNEDKTDGQQIFEGKWVRERWWYKFAHICQRWRSLILGSASYLDLCLVCTYRTPIADMIAHSPHFPLVIDYLDEYDPEPANYEDDSEAGILIALEQRDRVRRIRLGVSASHLERLIVAIDKEFPMLEYLCIMPMDEWNTNEWILPTTFQAPRLRHLILSGFALPIRSPLLTTEAGLVTLSLQCIDPSSYFSPNDLLQQLSLMHHLQSFAIDVPHNDAKEQLLIIIHVTLPNLRSFAFQGGSGYLETLLPHITTPLLEKLYIGFYNHPIRSVPHLRQFIIATENLTGRPSSAMLQFDVLNASVALYPDVGSPMYSLCLRIEDFQIIWELALEYFLDVLRPILSEVVHLTLEYQEYTTPHSPQPEWFDKPNYTDWCKCLGAFGNVKTLSMHNYFVKDISHSLQLDDGVFSVDLLPKLNKLECYGSGNASDAFTPFIDACKDAGCPVTLVPFEHFPFRNNSIRPGIPSSFPI